MSNKQEWISISVYFELKKTQNATTSRPLDRFEIINLNRAYT